jgi:serine O-acetyltransferase
VKILRQLAGDATTIAKMFTGGRVDARELFATMSHDGSQVLVLSRLAEAARRHRIPIVGGLMRRLQTALFGIEIARDVKLGEGVVFVHTVGVVIGGNAEIGDRVVFLGSNTLGSAGSAGRTGGYPRIGNDVVIGAGARILGGVTIGDGASIGANAVVLCDVPAGAAAVGVPATVKPRSAPSGPRIQTG